MNPGFNQRTCAMIVAAIPFALAALLAAPVAAQTFEDALSVGIDKLAAGDHDGAAADAQDAWQRAETVGQKHDATRLLVQAALERGRVTEAREALRRLEETDGLLDEQMLQVRLQLAGTFAVEGDAARMKAEIDQAEQAADVSPATVMESLWAAARLFKQTRDYEAVHPFLARAAAMREQATDGKRYTVPFRADVPVGPGGWAQWNYAQAPAHRASRFEPYVAADAELLIADITANRPQADGNAVEADGSDDAGTAFVMAYDTKGWHIYIHSQEPMVDRVMAESGSGGSSLEMFFTPALERAPYYQWIANLATDEVDIYHWSTPHRGYRRLEQSPWSMQVRTVVLDDGWGTLITIAWESLYDRLPFDGAGPNAEPNPWRFSLIRWSPHGNVTWGGRVHETGRWGEIHWQPPTSEQRLAIQRHIIKRAWSRFQSTANSLSTFWSSANGDEQFHQEHLAPLIEHHKETYSEPMQVVDEWDAQRVERVFREQVPVWMEFDHVVADRRAEVLADQLMGTSEQPATMDR